MRDEIEFNGIPYVSVRDAADHVGLSRDYVGRLCRTSMIDARRIGSAWYLDLRSLEAFLRAQEHAREYRRQVLVRDRTDEYRAKQEAIGGSVGSRDPARGVARDASIPERMRHAVEETSVATLPALSESASVPGLMHAAVNVPAQAIVHIPTYAITPTIELIHRVAALLSAFVIVFGAYSIFDHTYANAAAQSFITAFTGVSNVAQSASAAVGAGSAQASNAIETMAANPDSFSGAVHNTAARIDSSLRSVAAHATSLSKNITQLFSRSLSTSASTHDAASSVASAGAPVSTALGANQNTPSGGPVAIAINFRGRSVSYGDVVSYDKARDSYSLTNGSNDATAYGVVVRNPALLFRPREVSANVAIIRSGPTLLNVTMENGPIATGDPLTTASIPGKARRANDGEHVIAYAQEPFTGAGGVHLKLPDGSEVLSGTISVNVTVGSSQGSDPSLAPNCTGIACRLAASIDPLVVRALVRYLLSGIIAALTLTLAFKSFMSDANNGVISMGRNPRAKSSIQSLVFFNALLAVAIASTGLFAAMMVLFAG